MSSVSIRALRKTFHDFISVQTKRDEERIKYDAERRKEEAERRKEEAARVKREEEGFKRLRQELGSLGISYGEQVEAMFVNLGEKFNSLGFNFPKHAEGRVKFHDKDGRVLVEVDRLLENGEAIMSIEVKAKLKIDDVRNHIKRLVKISEFSSLHDDNRKVLGAVAGGVVPKNVMEYAIKRGLYVLVQNGDSVEIADVPTDFKPREW